MNCNYKENPGVLVKGMRGRGRGKDMACCTQGLPLLITNNLVLVLLLSYNYSFREAWSLTVTMLRNLAQGPISMIWRHWKREKRNYLYKREEFVTPRLLSTWIGTIREVLSVPHRYRVEPVRFQLEFWE